MSPRSRGRRGDRRRPSDTRRARRREDGRADRPTGPHTPEPGADTAFGQLGGPTAGSTGDPGDGPTGHPAAEFAEEVLAATPQLMALTSPLQAEGFVSSVIGTWWQLPSQAFGPVLVAEAGRADDAGAVALLHGLAALAEPQVAAQARAALDGAGCGERTPAWAATLGSAKVERCLVVTEDLGDNTQYILVCAYPGEEPHALVVLVDHNLGGIAKDVWATDRAADLEAQAQSTVAADPDLTLTEVDLADAKIRLGEAFAATDEAVEPPLGESFRDLRAVLLARLRTLPDGGSVPEPPPWPDTRRAELVEDFAASPEVAELGPAEVEAARAFVKELVDFGCEYDRGQPLRVSPVKLEGFLLGWLPRTGLLDRRYVDAVPAALPAWVRYAGRRNDLSAASVDGVLAAVRAFVPRFAETYDDPSAWGPARTAVESLLADLDPDQDNADEVFERRMFALDRVPAPGFDVTDEDAVAKLVTDDLREGSEGSEDTEDAEPTAREIASRTAVVRHLWFDDPPELWATARRLVDAGHARAEVLAALAYALADAAREGDAKGVDAVRLSEALDALPGSWKPGSWKPGSAEAPPQP
ncbi:hypothetical protein [Actinopolymorpha rutila]|uniref:Uncharacterized protein n=1 Tax=Actinopolymorpha rutila TaxID=446787 RepID=A0A852ZFC8_9ACTN|nr:hypothetical protein [Actinopolymorpha rutila]NYH91013.1 hypothetical protein [Actinopolymorpha rutila]